MRPKILIVEDEPAIADTIHYALETDGCEPILAGDGAKALEVLEQKVVDLIILDIGLPDVSGFDLCKQIRRQDHTPIIFLTARSDEIILIA